jgi:hypothetical protein
MSWLIETVALSADQTVIDRHRARTWLGARLWCWRRPLPDLWWRYRLTEEDAHLP